MLMMAPAVPQQGSNLKEVGLHAVHQLHVGEHPEGVEDAACVDQPGGQRAHPL